ncbi:CBS domain-containing protein [Virgibacillus sp. 179-BFC.A HS]|uniref:CBS domain-containing protein n=1 Tax=Tigheibacillus jepli TaxID=3035914 RepID=A0ABU5CHF7_9BACI|nr:CBS domain-containing protein [Virgibacillus sp. 179-BFC.A HS]MDY0405771.1 CBS domain-containing protein [Virgibacillus sp. 179-BFC.A HS]
MNVSDFMITDVISVSEKTTLRELLEILVNGKIGGVPVVDKDNHLLGMISDGDVLRYIQPKGRTIYDAFSLVLVSDKEELKDKLHYTLDKSVTNIMRKQDLKYVHPEDPVENALKIFSSHHFKKIPVIDKDGKVIGVISRGDMIRFINNELIKNNDKPL